MNKGGYYLNVAGTAFILLWIGIFKFTPTEAKAIQPLVANHFLMSWLYNVLSIQAVSNLIGVVEIIVGIGMLAALKWEKVGNYAGYGAVVIFATTLSFLLTTPNTWRLIDGVPITDFFILKDLALLGSAMLLIKHS
jgi:uncharacterized membrane protein YkgB